MNVELESPLKRALLKGCPWMDGDGGSSEGGQDEASQQPIFQQQQRFITRTYGGEKLSRFYYF